MESGARDGAVVISGSGLMVRVWSSGFRSVFERGLGRVFPSILFPILRYLRCISAPASVVNASEIAMGSQVLPGLGAGHSLPHSRSSPGSSTNSRFETFFLSFPGCNIPDVTGSDSNYAKFQRFPCSGLQGLGF